MAKVFLLTGLSGAGKTTLSQAARRLLRNEHDLLILDGDEMRGGLNRDLGFSREDREENVRRCGELAKLLAAQNKSVLLAIIAPYESSRRKLGEILGKDLLRVVHIACPLEICVSRDPKQNYRKAFAGHLKNYTGIADPFEPPPDPHLKLDTSSHDKETCARALADFIRNELKAK